MNKYTLPHLKLGGTSFLLPTDYIPGVRFAAERCEDVALLLLETGDGGRNLATPAELAEIARIMDGEGASLHVHLPTDADFDTPRNARAMVAAVREVVERTARLCPHSFVLHVDFPSLYKGTPDWIAQDAAVSAEQRQWTAEALADIAACLPSPDRLAVENLEAFPPNFWDAWIDATPYSRCLDVGHVWKVGGDPAPVLKDWLPRVRVIHLHGLEPRPTPPAGKTASPGPDGRPTCWPRDHTSLRLMSADRIDAVMHPLWRHGFPGVLTLEVFSFDDFADSHAALLRSWERYERMEECVH